MKNYLYLFFICAAVLANAQNVGINNTDPQAALDLSGDLRLRSETLTAVMAGLNVDVDISTLKSSIYMFNTLLNGVQISGFNGGVDGRMITVFNNTTGAVQLYDESNATNGSLAQNKILTGTGNTAIIYGNGSVTMRYDGAKMRWTVVSSNYTDGLDATAPGSGPWTVSGNDISSANSGNVGIGTSTPNAKLDVNGTFSLQSDTIEIACAAMMADGRVLIDNAVKKKSFFHLVKKSACAPTNPIILGLKGGFDGHIITITTHVNYTPVKHLVGLTAAPTALDSTYMIELYEPSGNGSVNEPSELILNKGGSITLIYDSQKSRWKLLSYYGERKTESIGWIPGGTPNSIIQPSGFDKVGIQFFNPTERLHVGGNIALTGEIKPNGTAGMAGQVLKSNGGGTMSWGSAGEWLNVGVNHIRNPNTGNVGIGEINPVEKLQVGGGNVKIGPDIEWNSVADNKYLKFGDGPYVSIGEVGGDDKMEIRAKDITLKSTNGNILVPTGNLCIGANNNLNSPLSFGNNFGKKISFWNIDPNKDYGIGIQSGEMQLYTAFNNSIISFGYGTSDSYTRTMAYYPGSGQLGINCLPILGYNLAVNGPVKAKEVVVELANWPDYVFAPSYKLPSLASVEQHIKDHNHLPNIPSAKTMEANGQSLGETQRLMMEKIEELTLYIIEQNKRIEKLEAERLSNTKSQK